MPTTSTTDPIVDPSVKKLEDVLDPSSINYDDHIPNDPDEISRNWNEYGTSYGGGCTSICFDKYGIDYDANQLIGYGFDSICNTCDNHYSIIFMDPVEFPDVQYLNSGQDYILMLPLDNTIARTGKDLVRYIMREVNDPDKGAFTGHYQQYAIKDNTIYIFDNRSNYNNVGKFFTYVFKICIKIEAEYIGPQPIKIGEDYDPNHVIVYGTWHDNTRTVLRHDLYTFSSLTVTQYGPNTFTVRYVRNPALTATFTIDGLLITGIEAEYRGPEVLVEDEYDPQYVVVQAITVGDHRMPLLTDQCTFPNRIIIDNKYNRKECEYIDEFGDKFTCEFIVQGIPRPIAMYATYIGPLKVINDRVIKKEFKVQLKYLLNIFDQDNRQTEIVDITEDEWEFFNGDIITETNDGLFTLTCDKIFEYCKIALFVDISVPYIGYHATLKCWYEGPDIVVDEDYNLEHVVIYICQPGKDRIRLLYNDAGVIMNSDIRVPKEGVNFYTIQYINGRVKLKGKYFVIGIIPKEFPEVKFQVLYIVKDTFEEIDLTEDFEPYFTFYGNFVITWQQFLNRLIDYNNDGTPYFGMFRVVAPKRTGFLNKYASEWHVYCFDDFNLKAEIFKIYSDEIKEDDDNGQTEEESNGGTIENGESTGDHDGSGEPSNSGADDNQGSSETDSTTDGEVSSDDHHL